jgi:hypothetical protein
LSLDLLLQAIGIAARADLQGLRCQFCNGRVGRAGLEPAAGGL